MFLVPSTLSIILCVRLNLEFYPPTHTLCTQLGWSYNILERKHLDAFEEQRGPQRAKKFTKEKKLTRLEREKILRGSVPLKVKFRGQPNVPPLSETHVKSPSG